MYVNKPLEEMSLNEMTTWACGEILIGIGEGKFRAAVTSVIMAICQVKYELGKKRAMEEFEASKKK